MELDTAIALLRTKQIKKRLAGLTSLAHALQASTSTSTSTATDPEFLATLLPDVIPCLKDNNCKIALSALEIVQHTLQFVSESTVRSFFKLLWSGIVERLGDSKLSVREKAVDVVVTLVGVVGLPAVLDRLRLCVAHKNWRTREQTVHAVWRCLEYRSAFAERKHDVLQDVVGLLEDSSKEVRDAAMLALEKFYTYLGPVLLDDLESKHIRPGHMRTLSMRFSNTTVDASASTFRSIATAPSNPELSATARFLSAIKSRQSSIDNITNNAVPASSASPSQENHSKSNEPTVNVLPVTTGMSDRDIQREMTKIGAGLHKDNNWSVRVEFIKSLQLLVRKCSDNPAALTAIALHFRGIREAMCEQVGDLRSSVAREACQTLQVLAKILKDEYNPHAEYCIGSLMKATYVTILVISTAADTSIRSIIESTSNGYTKLINKFIEGAKTRNQVLRQNSAGYLTLAIERWSVPFLSKHVDLIVEVLPSLLHDALGEVRAQARTCFWVFHHLFPAEADKLFEHLDLSTQKNLRDDPARDCRSSSLARSGIVSNATTSNRVSRKDSLKTAIEAGLTSDQAPTTLTARLSSGNNSGARTAPKVAAAPPLGPRRVLGSGSGIGSDSDRSNQPRIFSQGAQRVGLSPRPVVSGDDIVSTGVKSTMGPQRVVKSTPAPRPEQRLNVFQASLQSSSRASRMEIGSELSVAPSRSDTSESSVARSDRANPLKRRAVIASQSDSTMLEGAIHSSSALPPRAQAASVSSSTSSGEIAPINRLKTTSATWVADGLNEALTQLEDPTWNVRLEAVDVIERWLEKTKAVLATDKKVDERVLSCLIRHCVDPHYRVAQGSLKCLLLCLPFASTHQLSMNLKSLLPKLFQKIVDPKEAVRTLARDLLAHVVTQVDPNLLVAHMIPLLADGSNMKTKPTICNTLRDLLPRAREYFEQSANNAHMRQLLARIAQLADSDAPVTVIGSCSEVLKAVATLYVKEVDAAMPLLAPTRRALLVKTLRSCGIVLSLAPASSNFTTSVSTTSSSSNNNNQTSSEPMTQPSVGRKRHAPSPLKLPGSPMSTGTTPSEEASPVVVADVTRLSISTPSDRMRNSKPHSDFASLLSASSKVSSSKRFEELLVVLRDNNIDEPERISALHKMTSFITNEPDSFWDEYFSPVLSLLLESAVEHNVSALRVLQRLLRAQPQRTQASFQRILPVLLDSITGRPDLATHLAELTLADVIDVIVPSTRTLELLVPLLSSTTDSGRLLVVLQLVRVALDATSKRMDSSTSQVLRSESWSAKFIPPLVEFLHHGASDVRKRAVDCLVAYYFATEEDQVLATYLTQHVDTTKRRLVDIFIDRKRAEAHERCRMDCTE